VTFTVGIWATMMRTSTIFGATKISPTRSVVSRTKCDQTNEVSLGTPVTAQCVHAMTMMMVGPSGKTQPEGIS